MAVLPEVRHGSQGEHVSKQFTRRSSSPLQVAAVELHDPEKAISPLQDARHALEHATLVALDVDLEGQAAEPIGGQRGEQVVNPDGLYPEFANRSGPLPLNRLAGSSIWPIAEEVPDHFSSTVKIT